MTTEMRKTGVDVVGDVPWGTHFCLFYETKADLLETLVCYCKAGLESQEFCLWVVAEPLTAEDARRELKRTVAEFDRYFLVVGAVIGDYPGATGKASPPSIRGRSAGRMKPGYGAGARETFNF
jgi:hypothetical protein